MTTTRLGLLLELLEPLVREWGPERVLEALGKLQSQVKGETIFPIDNLRIVEGKRKSTPRPNAVEQTRRAFANGPLRLPLLRLAALYDERRFLPSVSDVREFLAMSGGQMENAKDRSEAFRHLLSFLADASDERIERLISSEMHSGPAKLGPISSAIKSTGERIRGREPSSESES